MIVFVGQWAFLEKLYKSLFLTRVTKWLKSCVVTCRVQEITGKEEGTENRSFCHISFGKQQTQASVL